LRNRDTLRRLWASLYRRSCRLSIIRRGISGGCRRDSTLNDNIGRPADHNQVFDVVTANQHKAATRIDCRGIKHLEARVPVAAAPNKGGWAAAAAQKPQDADKACKPDGNPEHRDDEPAAIGAHKFFHHVWHSWFKGSVERRCFSALDKPLMAIVHG
jgi:hypothetical protein